MTIINENINTKIAAFKELLDSITTLQDKRKLLWQDVYTNALQDRDYAFQMYTHLSAFVTSGADPNVHALHGPNIAKYLERMGKANDQLLKLAELVASALDKQADVGGDSGMSQDDLYNKFIEEPVKIGKKR